MYLSKTHSITAQEVSRPLCESDNIGSSVIIPPTFFDFMALKNKSGFQLRPVHQYTLTFVNLHIKFSVHTRTMTS